MKPSLILHGGAWRWPDSQDEPKATSIKQALAIGWDILANQGSALDAVEAAIRLLEDDPLFDAGTGSHLNADGLVEMDALIIDGSDVSFGAVGAVQRVRHPITLARHVLTLQQNFFVGAGADALAMRAGIPPVTNLSLVSDAELALFRRGEVADASDTVGAIAIDRDGNIAVGTSTGGTPAKPAGRVGDSPIFGAGGYADNRIGGATATGNGEHSMRLMLSHRAVQHIANGADAANAARQAIAEADVQFADSMVGVLVIDREGRIGAAHSTPKLALGWINDHGHPQTSMQGGYAAHD